MGAFITKKISSGDWPNKIPASFYNKVDEVLSGLEVKDGTIEKDGNKWTIVPTTDTSTGTGVSLDGYEIYYSDGTSEYVANADALLGYDSTVDNDWSLEFGVSSASLNSAPTGTSSTGLYVINVSGDQTKYRLPIIRNSNRISAGGAYRENIFCSGSDGPIAELVRIG